MKLSDLKEYTIEEKEPKKLNIRDLDSYEVEKASEPEKMSTLEAGAVGATQGLTMNFADELAGGVSALAETALGDDSVDKQLREQGFKLPEESIYDKYKTYRDAARKQYEQAQKDQRAATIIGEIAGGIAPALATGGAAALSKEGLRQAAKTAVRESGEEVTKKALQRAAAKKVASESAVAGAKFGGVSGLGLTEDITDAPQTVGDVALGTALGGLIGGVTPAAGQALKGTKRAVDRGVDFIRDRSPVIDKALAAAKRARRGEKFIGKKAREEMMDEQRQLIREAFDELEQVDKTFGKKTGEILAKSENKIDVVDDVLELAGDLEKRAAEYGRSGFETQEKRVAGMANKLKDIISTGEQTVSGKELARQEAVRKARSIKQDASVDAANRPEPKLSDVKIDKNNKIAYYIDENTGQLKSVMYDFDESFVDEFADDATQYARGATTRERAVQEKAQKILAENRRKQGSEVESLMGDSVEAIDEEDAYRMADEAISEINFDDETKRFVVFDEDTGKPFTYEPKYVTKDEAIKILNNKRNIDLKQQQSKSNLAKAETEMLVKEDPVNERFVIYSKSNDRLKKRGEVRYKKDKVQEGELLSQKELTAEELDRLAKAQGDKYKADQELGVQRESARMFDLLRSKTKQAIGGEASEQYSNIKAKSSMLKTIRDTLNPGLSSFDKAQKARALRSLEDALDKTDDNIAVYRAFKQFFDDITQVDPAYAAKYREKFMDLAERIALGDPSNVGAHSVSGRAALGTIETIGIGTGAVAGRVARGLDKIIDLPKTAFSSVAAKFQGSTNPIEQQFANVMNEMSNSSKTRRNALMFSLSQNPAFKKILEEELGVDFTNNK